MPSPLSADDIIALLDLQPLAGEGGYFRETWQLPAPDGGRHLATSILYLVMPISFSALHRLDHDELFHYYMGDPCRMVLIDLAGEVHEVKMGHDLRSGMVVQQVVPAGWWQATDLIHGGRWALLGTTNTPGYVPEGFELATAETIQRFPPEAQQAVKRLVAGQAQSQDQDDHPY